MRENCTYGLTRGRAYPAGALRSTLHPMATRLEELPEARQAVDVFIAEPGRLGVGARRLRVGSRGERAHLPERAEHPADAMPVVGLGHLGPDLHLAARYLRPDAIERNQPVLACEPYRPSQISSRGSVRPACRKSGAPADTGTRSRCRSIRAARPPRRASQGALRLRRRDWRALRRWRRRRSQRQERTTRRRL